MEQYGQLYLTSDEQVLFDDNYRYIISPIEIAHVTKKGTAITILTNIDRFSQELQFNKNIIISVLGKKLSCKSGIDKTTKSHYLQGHFTEQQIKDILYKFIQNYLLCSTCNKPEVQIKCKHEQLRQKCRACGNKSYLDVDYTIFNIFKKIN